MMLTEVGVGKPRSGRKLQGQASTQSRGLCAIKAKVVAMEEEKMDRLSGKVGRVANGTNLIPVTFWGPDGSCYEGMSPHVAGEVVFVASKRLIPVDTEVTLRFTPLNEVLVNRGVAKGTVAWHYSSSDHFKNLAGFGVCLQGRWPQPPKSTGNDGPKEAA